MNLRQGLEKLAHSHPELRQHLVPILCRTAAAQKKDVELKLYDGSTKTVSAFVLGNWGVYKALAGSGWALTFLPTSQMALKAKTKMEALGALEAISREPSLLKARTHGDVMRHEKLLKQLVAQTSGKKPVIDIEKILSEEGLANQGSRYGKAGEFWGIAGSSRMIAVGRRDVLLNVFFVGIDSTDAIRRPDTRWLMKNNVLKTKMTEDKLRKWAKWAKQGLSTKKLREAARKLFLNEGKYVGIDGGMYRR